MSRSHRILYTVLGSGVALAFLGHGILAAKGNEKFAGLVTSSYDKLLGGSMSEATATDLVRAIGVIDIVAATVMLGLVAAAWAGHRIAVSRFSVALFAAAAGWGLVTAASRFTATLNGAEVWDVVERGPNWMLPAGLAYMIVLARRAGRESGETEAAAPSPNGGRRAADSERVPAG